MYKVFTLNKNNKIELTKNELQKLLDESYWDGYNSNHTWTYRSPSNWWDNVVYTTNTTSPYRYETTSTVTGVGECLTVKTANEEEINKEPLK